MTWNLRQRFGAGGLRTARSCSGSSSGAAQNSSPVMAPFSLAAPGDRDGGCRRVEGSFLRSARWWRAGRRPGRRQVLPTPERQPPRCAHFAATPARSAKREHLIARMSGRFVQGSRSRPAPPRSVHKRPGRRPSPGQAAAEPGAVPGSPARSATSASSGAYIRRRNHQDRPDPSSGPTNAPARSPDPLPAEDQMPPH